MKKILVLLFLLSASLSSFCQETKDPGAPLTKQDYLKKSKSQKTFAWVLLGVGATCVAIVAPGNVSLDAVGAIVVIGGVCVLSSIPLFIASSKNKKRAMAASASLEMQKIQLSPGIQYRYAPGLSVKISF